MSIRIVRLGSPRAAKEGLRIGTVRRPPRGVPKSDFAKRDFYAEMKRPEVSEVWDLLAALSHSTDLSIGCYCEDERRCHRSIMRELLVERDAALA
jgi:uncharacterized protein YeaO (DUF488 family)